jgi:hypothetical protein
MMDIVQERMQKNSLGTECKKFSLKLSFFIYLIGKSYMLKATYFLVLLLSITLTGCGQSQTDSPKVAEQKRELISVVIELSRNLAKAHPEHDAQYYADRLGPIIVSCANEADLDRCMKREIATLY